MRLMESIAKLEETDTVTENGCGAYKSSIPCRKKVLPTKSKEEKDEFLMVDPSEVESTGECVLEVEIDEQWEHIKVDCEDAATAYFYGIVRGVSDAKIRELADGVLDSIRLSAIETEFEEEARINTIITIFKLWAQTRNVRGGKGERDISAKLLIHLGRRCPEVTSAMVRLVPHFGSWRDVREIVALVNKSGCPDDQGLRTSLLRLHADQLQKDREIMEKMKGGEVPEEKLTLAGKWAARENKSHKNVAVEIAEMMDFGDESNKRRGYRKLIAELGAQLEVAEQKMCSGAWQSIKPGSVPSSCLAKKGKALQNLYPDLDKNRKSHPKKDQLRRPENEDRMACRENVLEHAEQCKKGKARMHGRNLQLDQLAGRYMNKLKANPCATEDSLWEAQWKDTVDCYKQEIEDESEVNYPPTSILPLVDMSGSMSGTPMEVAAGLGVLLSKITKHEIFRDLVLTFEATPKFHTVKGSTLHECMRSIMRTPWGNNTNIEMAVEKLVKMCKDADVHVDDLPALAIFSDMQFDAARREETPARYQYGRYGGYCAPKDAPEWETQYETLIRICAKYGYDRVPHVIYWNLRGDTDNVPVKSDTKGVTMMAGFSGDLLKMFLTGKLLSKAGERPDPNAAVRVALEDPMYDCVAEVVRGVLGA